MLSPPIAHESLDLPAHERLDLPSPKRQKIEETSYILDNDSDSESDTEKYGNEEYVQRYNEEIDRTGVFEIDFSKLPYWFSLVPLDLNDSTMVEEPETNKDYATNLARQALNKHNTEQNTNLKLGEITRANYHPCAGLCFYISFEVIDGDNQIIPYQAVVVDFGGKITIYSCDPRPSST